MTPPIDKLEYITEQNIRQKFNRSQYPIMISQGLLKVLFLRNTHLKEPWRKNEPYCTHSQMIRYSDDTGKWFVEVHQYLRPDNTLGGSGKADPKRLREGNIIYATDVQCPKAK